MNFSFRRPQIAAKHFCFAMPGRSISCNSIWKTLHTDGNSALRAQLGGFQKMCMYEIDNCRRRGVFFFFSFCFVKFDQHVNRFRGGDKPTIFSFIVVTVGLLFYFFFLFFMCQVPVLPTGSFQPLHPLSFGEGIAFDPLPPKEMR